MGIGNRTLSWLKAQTRVAFALSIVGFSNNYAENTYYGRDPGDSVDQKWDYGLGTSIAAESYVVSARTANFVATSACKITKLRGWALASGHTETLEIDIWKGTPVNASSANVTYSQIGSATSPSATTSNRVYDLDSTYSSGNTLSAGDVLMLTSRKTSGGSGNDPIYFTITLEIEFT